MQQFISSLLDQMQQEKENTDDVNKITLLNRIIAILEEYIK